MTDLCAGHDAIALADAKREDLDAETLTKLSRNHDARVRLEVAKNRTTPARILVLLSTDEDWDVRSAIATNRRTPVITLAKLACGADYSGLNAWTNPSFEDHLEACNELAALSDDLIDYTNDEFIEDNYQDEDDCEDEVEDDPCTVSTMNCECGECIRSR